jgi:cytidine deaminase
MHLQPTEFESAIGELPKVIKQALLDQLGSPAFKGKFTDLSDSPQLLAPSLLPLAASFSIAPISGFNVGAIAVGASGAFYLGANLEFVGAPLSATLHAEQSAILNAWMHGESSVTTLAISAAPCGFCRQFLWELPNASDLAILIEGQQTTLSQLLPMPFGPLRKPGNSLLDSPASTLESIIPLTSDHSQRAVNAAQRSYTPYTHSPEGFIIDCADGNYFTGRTAESIAFNPSVPAILCALNQRNLSNSRNYSIERCSHAKLATSLHSSVELATSILRGISNVKVQTIAMESV